MKRVSLLALAVSFPVICAAQQRCPWINAATAGGFLGGSVTATVTATSCEFVLRDAGHESSLRIEVMATSAPHAQCGPGAEPVKAIGNQATACSFQGKPDWLSEQVVGRVRDQAFLVRAGTNDRSASPSVLREKARGVAEQVAGFLF